MSESPEFTPKKRPRPHLTVERVIDALKQARGMVSVAARTLRCSRSGIYKYLARCPELKQIIDDERELMTDTAELSLFRAVTNGEAWAVCFYLKTQGRSRGYVEKTQLEHSGPNGGPIQHAEVTDLRGLTDDELDAIIAAHRALTRASAGE